MNVSIIKFFVVSALLTFAVFLFLDATIFGLTKANPATGRAKGCYTEFEIWMGVKRPTQWIRLAELAAAGVFAISGVTVMISGRSSK